MMYVALLLVWTCLPVTLSILQTAQSTKSIQQAYLDAEPVDSNHFLALIKEIKISRFRWDLQSRNRERLGAIGPEIATLIPEAVEIVPKRILPPTVKGGEPIVLHDVPVVNDNMIFWMSVGAQQALIKRVESLSDSLSYQVDQVVRLFGETAKLDNLLSESSSVESELRMKASIAKAKIAQSDLEIDIQRAKEEKDYHDLQKQMEMMELKRNEELVALRLAQEVETSRSQAEEEMRIRFESNAKIDRARNDAAEAISLMQFERDISLQSISEKMKAESAKKIAQAKADAERANEDVHIRKLKAEAEQNRKRNIEAINTIATHLASSLVSASKNPRQVMAFISYIALLATGIYTAREVAKLCRVIIESALGKPKLIRETTRKSIIHQGFDGIVSWFVDLMVPSAQPVQEDIFHDVVLATNLKQRILSIATSASKVRKNDAPHRHILFFGPPGTGKTMVARKMAKSIGMDYALMSGGDVAPLGNDAVTQIHNLFRWARLSKKGVLLFIDEAECFLGDRSKTTMSETAHNALNALLYNTGTERKDFMMILATNRAEDLDSAILDRCDESLLFPLPDSACRKALLTDYFLQYIRPMENIIHEPCHRVLANIKNLFIVEDRFRAVVEKDVMNEEQINNIVARTTGFSGREIAKLMIAVQGSVFASNDGVLTSAMLEKIVSTKVDDHAMKIKMMNGTLENEDEDGSMKFPPIECTHVCDSEGFRNELIMFQEEQDSSGDLSFDTRSEKAEVTADSNNLSEISCLCLEQDTVMGLVSSSKEETQQSEQDLVSTECSSKEDIQRQEAGLTSTKCSCDVM